MHGMVYRCNRRLRMCTPSLRMLIAILADISPSVLLQLLRMSLTLWLLQTLPSNSHDPQRRRTRTTYRRSSTRPKRSRRTSSITLNWPPNRMYTTLQPGRREDQARNGKASDVRIGRVHHPQRWESSTTQVSRPSSRTSTTWWPSRWKSRVEVEGGIRGWKSRLVPVLTGNGSASSSLGITAIRLIFLNQISNLKPYQSNQWWLSAPVHLEL